MIQYVFMTWLDTMPLRFVYVRVLINLPVCKFSYARSRTLDFLM